MASETGGKADPSPVIVTLIGYLVIIDSALNSIGWTLDLFAHHTLINRVLTTGWERWSMAATGTTTFWWWLGGPGEKAWEITLIPVLFCARLAAAIGFLQMKRWGQQWLIVTCWMGVIVWTGYNTNMTIFADVRFANVTFPVWGWWIYDIWFITPFLAIPYLHTVNREIFSE